MRIKRVYSTSAQVGAGSTTNFVLFDIAAICLETGAASAEGVITADVGARDRTNLDGAAYRPACGWKYDSVDGLAIVGTQAIEAHEDDSSWTAAYYVVGTTLCLRVDGDAAHVTEWGIHATLLAYVEEMFGHTSGITLVAHGYTKSASTDWGNASACFVATIPGDGWMSFQAGQSDQIGILGLSASDPEGSYAAVQFGFYLGDGGDYQVIENGSGVPASFPYAANKTFAVHVYGNVVTYWYDGLLVYTSLTAATHPLYAVGVPYGSGFEAHAITLSSMRNWGPYALVPLSYLRADFGGSYGDAAHPWADKVNCTSSGATLTKNAGGSAWNAGARSTLSVLTGNDASGSVSWKVDQLARQSMAGLSYGNTDVSYADIDFAIYTTAGNRLYVIESGGLFYDTGVDYAIGKVLKVACDAGTIKYYCDATLLHTSLISPNAPLVFDTSIYDQGTSITDVAFVGGYGNVYSWYSKDATSREYAQSLLVNQPFFVPNAMGSIAAVRGQFFGKQSIAAPAFSFTAGAGSIGMVFTKPGIASVYLWDIGGGGSGLIYRFVGSKLEWLNGADRMDVAASLTDGPHAVLITQTDGAANGLKIYLDGDLVVTATPTVVLTPPRRVVGYSGLTNGTDKYIFECEAVDRVISAGEIARWCAYTKARYGR
jgi:hypothetical protein